MTALASEFGWSEVFILVWLPLSRAEQYYHALLRRVRWRTTAPMPDAEQQLAAMEDAPPLPPLPVDIEELWKRFEK